MTDRLAGDAEPQRHTLLGQPLASGERAVDHGSQQPVVDLGDEIGCGLERVQGHELYLSRAPEIAL